MRQASLFPRLALIIVALFGAVVGSRGFSSAAESARSVPPPVLNEPADVRATSEVAILAGGCFWGVQGVFQHVEGVTSAVSGYAGGAADTAHYEMVSSNTTGHAESIRVTFDPHRITYGRILQIYFSVAHDPTELDRQGPDTGPSYRSEIFFTNASQERVARAYVAQLDAAHAFGKPIVTKIEPLKGFYAAEAYHQDYLIHNPGAYYIVVNDLPKIANLKRIYPELYNETAAALPAKESSL